MNQNLFSGKSVSNLFLGLLKTCAGTFFFLFLFFFSSGAFAATWYVKPAGTGSGTNWGDASGNLQDIINAAESGDEIWVAGGIYQPASGASFGMKEGVKIYGGFAGNEASFASRDLKDIANKSVLQGNGVPVVKNSGNGLTSAALLDGFTITGGRGGIVNESASPSLVNLVITQNSTGSYNNKVGGGVLNSQSSPVFTNCIISNNTSDSGGGMYNLNSSPILTNCLIFGNMATNAASALYNVASSPVLTNCTMISGKIASFDFIRNESKTVFKMRNSIVYGEFSNIMDYGSSSDIKYSLVQGVDYSNPDNHNVPGNVDPLFENFEAGDYQLQPCSPLINQGNGAYYAAGSNPDLSAVGTDLVGNSRFNSTADIGAYEYTGSMAGVVFVKVGGTGMGTNWECAAGDLQAAIDAANSGQQIWVAGGTYQRDDSKSFSMKEGVRIYGGFAGTEETFAQRDLKNTSNKSILQGNENSVLNNSELTRAAVLDGFTITGGAGSGIMNSYASPTLVNLVITDNKVANYSRGGLYNNASSPLLINCIISKNSAVSGSAMYNASSSPVLINCTISNNTGTSGEKNTIYNNHSNLVLRNSIVYGNTGGIENDDASTSVIQYSLVQGATNLNPEDHNMRDNVNPFFVDATAGNYQLQPCSALVNKGSNSFYSGGSEPDLSGITSDLGGNSRFYAGGVADIGAYEYQGHVAETVDGIVYVKAGGTGSGTSWECATGSLQAAIDASISGQQIWVAGGTYSEPGEDYIIIKEGVRIYGGFTGTETSLASRNLNNPGSKSILQGSSYLSVLFFQNITKATVLDGFTITNGKTAGLLIIDSSPMLANLDITGNSSADLAFGGGITNWNSSPTLTNCVIYSNSAVNGGGIYNYDKSAPIIVNCTIADNHVSGPGGGMYSTYESSPKLYNSIVHGNTSGVGNDGTAAWEMKFSLVQGATNLNPDDHNMSGDFNPVFLNRAIGNFRLLGCSPVINMGSNAYYAKGSEPDLSAVTTDLAGSSRFYESGVVDLGAYEYQGHAAVPVPGILFVKEGSTGGSGSSWDCATSDLQSAIDVATSGQQVWVAGGTYQPPSGSSFHMKEGVKIYGGFAGNEETLAQRNLTNPANKSILEGDEYPVINNSGLTRAAVLDGFTITGGSVGGVVNYRSSPMLVNLMITGNQGGSANGGGITNEASSPTLINCVISNNTAPNGGAMLNLSSSSPALINCTIVGNHVSGGGSGVIDNRENSSPQFYNSIVHGNAAGIKNDDSSVPSIQYSLVQGETSLNPDDHNISGLVNPLFADAATGNYQLLPCSQAINTGSNTYYAQGSEPDLSAVTTDLAGLTRFYNDGMVDMGAYEYQQNVAAPGTGILFVKADGTGSGTSWDCAAGDLQSAINVAASGQQIWVAAGNYQLVSDISFHMKEGVKIYGGFAGTETGLNDRNLKIAGNKSVLQGKGAPVVVFETISKATVLDGFTITGGTNGGIVNNGSSPMLVNLTITGNISYDPNRGSITNTNSSPTLVNCLINGNTANGGAMFNASSSPSIINCTIVGNTSYIIGVKGIYNRGNSSPKIYNSIVYDNEGGIGNDESSAPVIRYSLVQGATNLNADDHNFRSDTDPFFADATAGNYQLQLCSSLLNQGSNAFYAPGSQPDLSAVITDLAGNPRFYNGGVTDIGAYEYQGDVTVAVAGVVFVKAGGTGSGISFECAMGDLQRAIDAAKSGQQVWVAGGTYQSVSGSAFNMKEGVKVYGGFAGTETDLASRNLNSTSNKSILRGNGVSVVVFVNLSKATVLDGFTITGGDAGGVANSGSSPMLVNLIITGNIGNPTNPANNFLSAGGVTNNNSSPTLINCIIYGNNSVYGGAMYNIDFSSSVLINCTVANNDRWNNTGSGGIVNSSHSSLKLYNTIVYGNTGGGIKNVASSVSAMEYSLVEGENDPDPNHHNIPGDTYPLFVDLQGGDLHLISCSPVIDRGSDAFTSDIPTDMENNPRKLGKSVDLGAYEFTGTSYELAFDGDIANDQVSGDLALTTDGATCRNIAYLSPNGASPVSGAITARVWVPETQPKNFVKRHYEITPAINASAATARVTLYFTQHEFTSFNNQIPAPDLKLPMNAEDFENNKANLRIEKRSGTGDADGSPDSYSGPAATINPYKANGKVEWNVTAGRWEVSFDVTGFSGFFVNTSESSLPLHLISFTARKEEGSNLLQWNTADEVNTSDFEVQSSADARNFTRIGTVQAGGSGNQQYRFNDRAIYNETVYYRLKMLDLDGTFTYSKIVSLRGEASFNNVFPNPAGDIVTIRVSNALLKSTVTLHDLTGRKLQTIMVTGIEQEIDTKSLASGLYILKFPDGTSERFVKE